MDKQWLFLKKSVILRDFGLGNSFRASFPIICPWKTIKIDRNMKNKRAYPFIFQCFNFYFLLLFCIWANRRWYTMKSMASHQIKRNQEFLSTIFASFHQFLTYCSILEKTRCTWVSRRCQEVYSEDSGLKTRLKLAYWILILKKNL